MRRIGRPTCRLDFRVVPTRRKRMRDRPVPVPLLERPNQSSVRLIICQRGPTGTDKEQPTPKIARGKQRTCP
jgi:hypothetical protein